MSDLSTGYDFVENYLTFDLAGEVGGIAVLKIREMVRLQKLAPLPHFPKHVRGLLDLRGRPVPVIDLRVRYGLDPVSTDRSCIVVVQLDLTDDSAVQLGLIVDGIGDIISIAHGKVVPTCRTEVKIEPAHILRRVVLGEQVYTLLDVDRLLDPKLVREFAGNPDSPEIQRHP